MAAAALPALLTPELGAASLKHRRWGGARLAALYGAPPTIKQPIGESWEFSTLPGSESRCDGQPLGTRLGRPLPFLAKLIDTAMSLSVQVHPDDDRANGRLGKEEAWVILDADRDAALFAGVRHGVDADTFARAVRLAVTDPTSGSALTALLQPVPARPGTVILIPAGTVHVIGAGILLAEIQQPTDVTYRLFDHGSGRELQVEAALEATRISALPRVCLPDETPTPMVGKHLSIEILRPGLHHRHAALDELIVPMLGGASATVGTSTVELSSGALRLATQSLRYSIKVADGGGVVIGSCGAAIGNC